MELDPKRIWQHYQQKRVDKKSAINRLTTMINNSSDIKRRIECIHTLESIGIEGDFLFRFFENLMISDSNEVIRDIAIIKIRDYYIEKAFEPMCWAYRHESSMKCIINIIQTLGEINNHLAREYIINELINTELAEHRKNLLRLIKGNKNKNYNNRELASMLINYHILKLFLDKFKRLSYKIKDGYVCELDFSCIGHNIFNWNIINKIPNYIGFLNKLKKLDLKVNKIRNIPDSIGELTALNNLDLSNNQINIIPDSISQMRSLKVLNLRHNNLRSLPDTFGKLIKLKYLDLSHNQLTNLPQNFENLTNLEFLKLYGNKFEETPKELKNLKNLKYLEMGLNSINSIEQDLLNIISLEKLGLGSNNLDVKSLYKLKSLINLKEIEICDNNFKQIPHSFGELNQIKHLSIHNNQLSNLPDTFSRLNLLENLDLSWNNFQEIPTEILELPLLKNINLSGNKINSISNSIKELENLEKLDISYNKIRKKPKIVNSLEKKGVSVIFNP